MYQSFWLAADHCGRKGPPPAGGLAGGRVWSAERRSSRSKEAALAVFPGRRRRRERPSWEWPQQQAETKTATGQTRKRPSNSTRKASQSGARSAQQGRVDASRQRRSSSRSYRRGRTAHIRLLSGKTGTHHPISAVTIVPDPLAKQILDLVRQASWGLHEFKFAPKEKQGKKMRIASPGSTPSAAAHMTTKRSSAVPPVPLQDRSSQPQVGQRVAAKFASAWHSGSVVDPSALQRRGERTVEVHRLTNEVSSTAKLEVGALSDTNTLPQCLSRFRCPLFSGLA